MYNITIFLERLSVKIGLSYSRCVRDIVDGEVDINDVLVLITRTDFDPHDDDQWKNIWLGYGGGYSGGSPWNRPEWGGYLNEDEQKFRDISIELYDSGRMHQPRQFGANPTRRQEIWLETVLPSSELETNPAAKDAWDRFQVVAGLTGVKLDKEYK
jgi:hypothetical protein